MIFAHGAGLQLLGAATVMSMASIFERGFGQGHDGHPLVGQHLWNAEEQPPHHHLYVLDSPIAEGGEADVWLARQLVCELCGYGVDKPVAARVVERTTSDVTEPYEAGILRSLGPHRGLVELIDVCSKDETHYALIMPHYSGGDLAHWVFLPEEPRSLENIFSVAVQVIAVLRHLHQKGVTHNDVKLENFLIASRDDPAITVKLIDFGFARSSDTGDFPGGTIGYLPCEAKERPYAPGNLALGDAFALGVTLLALMTARFPRVMRSLPLSIPHATSAETAATVLQILYGEAPGVAFAPSAMLDEEDRKDCKDWYDLKEECEHYFRVTVIHRRLPDDTPLQWVGLICSLLYEPSERLRILDIPPFWEEGPGKSHSVSAPHG